MLIIIDLKRKKCLSEITYTGLTLMSKMFWHTTRNNYLITIIDYPTQQSPYDGHK